MTLLYLGFLLALFGLSLILITLSLRHLKKSAPAGETYPTAARFFLVALRIAIGWHCFVEGLEKVSAPTWSSEAYLRESVGPLSDVFRWVPGDRLLARVTLGPENSFPAELDRDWQRYFDAFAAHYDLTEEQRERAKAILAERKASTLTYLQSKKETVTKISPYPPDLKIDMTMKQRLEEHERLRDRVRRAEAAFPSADKDVHAEWKTAKADLAKWRAELKKSIDAQTEKLKKIDPAVKDKLKKSINELTEKWKNAKGEKASAKAKQALDEETEKYWEPLGVVLTSVQKEESGPMADIQVVPLASWRLLEYSDFAVKWSLVLLGVFLLLGFLSRATSLATALLVLSFYAAMPPLPGWPESPRLEGHYLLINKTLIEVIALLALTFIPTGRWVGLDGLLCACCGGKVKAPPTTTV